MPVECKFILPDGTVVDTLPPAEMEKFVRKINESLLPLAYEAVMRDLQRERDSKKSLQRL